ncbi:MAG: hypothetical protein AAFP08_15010 [Bacteroidota bacterium]
MSSNQKQTIKLQPKAAWHLLEWLKGLQEMRVTNAYQKQVQLSRQPIIEKLHGKTLMATPFSLKLKPEHSHALLISILTEPWPTGYYTVVLSSVRDQLPPLSSYRLPDLALPPGVEWE